MADILIHEIGTSWNNSSARKTRPSVVWTGTDTCYMFYGKDGEGMFYKKSVDKGFTWGSETLAQADVGNNVSNEIEVYYDQWTPGGTGRIIHCGHAEPGGATTSFFGYSQLDTSDDSITARASVFTHGSVVGTRHTSIVKAIDGTLYMFNGTGSGNKQEFSKSVDNGISWSSALAVPANIVAASSWKLVPAFWRDDEADIAIVWFEAGSTDEWQLKEYDSSGDSWSSTLIFGVAGAGNSEDFSGPGVSIRHSDGHVIAAMTGGADATPTNIRIWDLNGSASITELTPVVTSYDFPKAVVVLVAPNDDIYVGYGKRVSGASYDMFYKKSTDGGTTWGAETAYSSGSDDWNNADGPLSMQNGGQFAPIIFEYTAPSTSMGRYINADNAVEIGGSVPVVALASFCVDYVPLFGGAQVTLDLDIKINELREKIETNAIALNTPELENQSLSLNYAKMTLTLKGTVAGVHPVHPPVAGHNLDIIDLEEMAILWNRGVPTRMVTFKYPLLGGERVYRGLINRVTIVENPGTDLVDFIIVFAVAWNVGIPAFRGWA